VPAATRSVAGEQTGNTAITLAKQPRQRVGLLLAEEWEIELRVRSAADFWEPQPAALSAVGKRCRFRNLDSCVSIVEPAKDRIRINVSQPLDRARVRTSYWSPGRHYNADIEQPALDMSLARGGHCPVRIVSDGCVEAYRRHPPVLQTEEHLGNFEIGSKHAPSGTGVSVEQGARFRHRLSWAVRREKLQECRNGCCIVKSSSAT
jgi:hypothetical protein